jgi:hypothetical protein
MFSSVCPSNNELESSLLNVSAKRKQDANIEMGGETNLEKLKISFRAPHPCESTLPDFFSNLPYPNKILPF